MYITLVSSSFCIGYIVCIFPEHVDYVDCSTALVHDV